MYGYIPPSNPLNQNNYGYAPPPQPHYGGPAYGQAYGQDPGRNYNNSYRNVQNFQPLTLNQALEQSVYPTYNRDYIKDFMINDFFENNDAKVYLQEKLFVIFYTLNVNFNNKSYKIYIYIHIPELFPNYPPEIYVQKKPKTGLNKSYMQGKISPLDFRIDIDKFEHFDPSLNSIKNIINSIRSHFNKDFPIYKDTSNQYEPELFGKNNINKNQANLIKIESENFTEDQFSSFMKKQAKDIVNAKLSEFNQKFNINQNYKELININSAVKMKSGQKQSNNDSSDPMSQDLEKLKKIKAELNTIETELQQEIHHIQNENKTSLEKCQEYITIKDEKDMEYAVMKKTIEDYLVYLKKGYEKRLVSFDDMVNNTRMLSREIFSIDYLRKQRKSYY